MFESLVTAFMESSTMPYRSDLNEAWDKLEREIASHIPGYEERERMAEDWITEAISAFDSKVEEVLFIAGFCSGLKLMTKANKIGIDL